ncbi:MAG: Holliday junction branch migration protein RuvA [Methylococcaceae bacterium]|jgi:Holliday junction DNA helicase RuvA
MIAYLRGKLVLKAPPALVLDVQGVGYEVEAPMTTFYDLPELGEVVQLFTHLVVREDAHLLFGFLAESDRLMFRALIKVNGVGPKLALTILSGQSAEQFQRCIRDNDSQALVRLPGIGKKTAERLIIEMRDKLPGFTDTGMAVIDVASVLTGSNNPRQEALSALCALGYKAQDASRMIQAVGVEGKTCEDIIRQALQGANK